MESVLAGDTIVGDREPQRLVDDECERVGADAGIIVERRQRDAIERHGGKVGLAPREYSSNFTSTGAPHTLQKPRCVPGVDS